MKETLHIYTRVSTRIQEKGESLDTQKELGVKKAKDLGYKHKIWNEGSASSHHEDLTNRPVLTELLGQIESGVVEHLFVFDNDRLSRNEDTQYTIRYALTRNQVSLYTSTGQFDLNNPSDKLLKGVLDEIAQYNNTITAERSRLGKIARVRQGFWYGGSAPYGYQITDKKLVIHKEQSKWVKKMFRWYYDGKPIIWIKRQLDKNGVVAKRGGLFSPGTINVLLKNTHYIGHYTWTDKKLGEPITCECPSIIDETIWNAAQARREKEFARVKQNNRTQKFYLLRDFLVCGECGSNMSGRIHPAKREQNYYCPKKTRDWKKGALPDDLKWKRGKVGENGCVMNRSLNIPITDKQIWDLVMDVVSNSSILKEQFKSEVLQSKFKGDEENDASLKREKAKITRLKNEVRKVQSSLADVETKNLLGEYDAVVYGDIKAQLVEVLKNKKEELEQTRIRTKELGREKSWLDWLGKYGDQLTVDSDLSNEDKKEYLKGLVDKIEVQLDKDTNDHHLEVFFRLGLVGDGIQYDEPKRKGGGYKVVEGSKNASVVISTGKTQKNSKKNDLILPPIKNNTPPWSSGERW
uniref:Resolvase domain-containing protein (SpoIVCA) n=1 Tax=uncultured marine group II/III euryarchaeote KM3_75_E04 TaxID=1456504 RepID=A0A075HKI7_9EURY|nr:resolvase domain-containing protein (spoIVCA) [uncultured marine group II/III euryarchaeote KM3_75_E04]